MKKENGYTGVDIAISVIVITIFIALIGTLVFNFNSSSNEMEYKSKALDIAINKIEEIKALEIGNINNEAKQELNENKGFYQEVKVIDATELQEISDDSEIKQISGLVKKVTVTVSYQFRNQTKSVELSTIISREF